MTFLNLQDRVMSRLNLTETAARNRIKTFINERYRRLSTSIGISTVRRSTITFNTVNGTYLYTPSTLIKTFTVIYTAGSRVLDQMSLDLIRNIDPDLSQTGSPERFAVVKYGATTEQLHLHPTPDAVYAMTVDGMITGSDLTVDADVPAFPEDFHDALEFGALADELEKLEKYKMAEKYERAFERRLEDLRYFIAKSAYLTHGQNQGYVDTLLAPPEWS